MINYIVINHDVTVVLEEESLNMGIKPVSEM
jgi:hypothetical protein